MNPQRQNAIDARALEAAAEARTVARETQATIRSEFREFQRLNSAQHRAVSVKIDKLREHVSAKVGDVHRRIDRLVMLSFCAVTGLLISVVAWLLDNSPPWRFIQ